MRIAIFERIDDKGKVAIPIDKIQLLTEESKGVDILMDSGKSVKVRANLLGTIDIIQSAKMGRRPKAQ